MKALALLLIFVASIGLTACGTGAANDPTVTPSPTVPPSPTETSAVPTAITDADVPPQTRFADFQYRHSEEQDPDADQAVLSTEGLDGPGSYEVTVDSRWRLAGSEDARFQLWLRTNDIGDHSDGVMLYESNRRSGGSVHHDRRTATLTVEEGDDGIVLWCGFEDATPQDSWCQADVVVMDRVQDELDAQRATWEGLGVEDYVMRFTWACYCRHNRGWVDVRVSDGEVVSVTRMDTGESVKEEFRNDFFSVDGLFDFLQDAIDQEADYMDVDYDPNDGYPLSARIDYVENASDEESGFDVVSLQPLSAE